MAQALQKKGLDGLNHLSYRGDPGDLSTAQQAQLQAEATTGRLKSAAMAQAFRRDTFGKTFWLGSNQGDTQPGEVLPQAVVLHQVAAESNRAECYPVGQQIEPGPGNLINACLQTGASSSIAYAETTSQQRRPRRPPRSAPPSFLSSPPPALSSKLPAPVDRYDPCPCGSGKKYKFCCGARK